MKSLLRSPRWLLPVVIVSALLLPSVVPAFPPAPYHRIYGLVRDEYGQPITAAGAQIVFEGTNGVAITTATIVSGLGPGVNYQLDLPMDSLTAPDLYKPTALKATLPFRIKVKIGSTTYLPIEMSGSYASLGKPAQSTRIDLSLGVDGNSDGLPDAWQQLLLAMLGPGALTGPNDDADGDGMSNWSEYIAGTYAFDPADVFRLAIVGGSSAAPLLQFTTVAGKTYAIYSSTNLVTWNAISFKIPASGPTPPLLPSYTAPDARVLQVEAALPAPAVKYFFKAQVQ